MVPFSKRVHFFTTPLSSVISIVSSAKLAWNNIRLEKISIFKNICNFIMTFMIKNKIKSASLFDNIKR
ncbi:hypothetical protein KB13_590 [beta proteobacterium KB13]|uniref:Uncharacterized protein n=1 Tax=beta proteobacterium KB13 TaxID=314607 RepID=B6BU04_9PROT|nr:hypothetical protein KB13_590 [beta proteobacterium KB13]